MTTLFWAPQRRFRVDAFRGIGEERRVMGEGLLEAEALKRAALAARIWPEMAAPKIAPMD
jgi:hypothetical protein